MIFRLLLLFLVIWFLLWILKKQFSAKNPITGQKNEKIAEDIIACDYCGTHVPRSSGIQQGDKFYCSQQHAELDHSS